MGFPRLAQSQSFFFMICRKCNTDVTDYRLIEGVRSGSAFLDSMGQRGRSKGPKSLVLWVRPRLWVRGGKVKFRGGCWFNWVVSVHPASAVSHLLTLSADCHSNGLRVSRDGPKPPGETPVSPRCVWTRTEAMPRMHCALGSMYTYSTNPIQIPFKWQIEKKEISRPKTTTMF